jgi:hypothetical protein
MRGYFIFGIVTSYFLIDLVNSITMIVYVGGTMGRSYFLLIFLILSLSQLALALTKSDVMMFKSDSNGMLHLTDDVTASGKVSVIIGEDVRCGDIIHTPLVKQTRPDSKRTIEVCDSSYSNQLRFSQKHKFPSTEIPLALGFKGCDVSALKTNPASKDNSKIITDFKTENNLGSYNSEKTQVFNDKGTPRYLSFIGILANTNGSKDKFAKIEGEVKRDFFVYDLEKKKFILQRKGQNCCVVDKHRMGVPDCSIFKMAEHECSSSYDKENFKGLVQHNNALYAYAVDVGMESFYGAIWELKDDKMVEVSRLAQYGLNGCR